MVRARVAYPAAVVAGACLAAAVPPIGWWPLAFVGWALADLVLADATPRARFARLWTVTVVWLAAAMLWMWDLTPPGYVVACLAYASYFGAAAALAPGDGRRRLALPAGVVLAEWARWTFPFGGVPLANLALTQIDAPWAVLARILGPLGLVAASVVGGQLLATVVDLVARRPPDWRPIAAVAPALLVLATAGGALAPRAEVVGEARVALVQGGGLQQTRASADQNPVVLGRHVEASGLVEGPVDLVVWPENVVNPGRLLTMDEAAARVAQVAAELDAPVSAGWFHGAPDDDRATLNYQAVTQPDGTITDRYEKVRIVPFGEFVPLRSFIENGPLAPLGDQLPPRDVRPGTEPAVLDTPLGPIGSVISWEGFFDTRARSAIGSGAVLLTNPTNGSSFWLDQVHTQQVASNRIWALAYDRWNLQVGPTGLTAVIDPDGDVLQITELREQAVLQATVELRSGRTPAAVVGPWPMLVASLLALAGVRRMGS